MAGRGVDRRRWTLLVVVLLALGFGAVAALIASPSHESSGSPTAQPYHPVPAVIFVELLWIGVPAFFAVWVGNLILTRARDGNSIPVAPALILFFVVGLLLVGILALAGIIHPFGGLGPAPPTNSTGTGSTGGGGGGTGVNGSCKNCTGNATGPPLTYPTWALDDLAFAGIGLVAILLLVYVVAVRRSLAGEQPEDAREAVRRELRRALEKLADSEPADPREIILALYARLLLRLQPRVVSTEPLTPREIERVLVEELGIRAAPAQQLTRIFEEARYSQRPIATGTVEQTRQALQQVLADLGGVVPHSTPAAAQLQGR
jgi:hypothetical protein